MIDLDFVCSDQYDEFCKELAKYDQNCKVKLINNVNLKVPNIKNAVETNFFTPIEGYTKPASSLEEHQLLDIFRYYDTELNEQLKDILKLDYCYINLHIQKPGRIICPHVDRNRTFLTKVLDESLRQKYDYTDVRRFLYFLEDQQLGQFFQIGNEYVKWKSGDLFEFPFFIPHTTANASILPRPILAITGI